MKAVNKFFIALFCFISAAVCGIIGVVINSIIWEQGMVPADLERRLGWFGENPDTSKVIVISVWVFSGLLVFLGILALVRISTDKRTTADTELGVEYKRIED